MDLVGPHRRARTGVARRLRAGVAWRARAGGVAVAAVAAVAGLAWAPGALTPAAASESSVDGVLLNGFESALVHDINAARTAHGLHQLVVGAGTTDVARRWSWHLATAQALSHNPAIVSDLEHAGSGAWTDIAENVGTGPSNDPQLLFTAYMNSPPHRANILDPKVRYLGIGVVERAGTAWNTLDFVDAYTSAYGRTRVPADGLTMDSTPILATTDVASLESPDQRFGTVHSGGVTASRMYFTGPSSGNDSGYAYVRRVSGAAGHGDIVLRDALGLGFAHSLSVQLATHDSHGRAVSVQVILGRAYGAAVSLGTVRVGAMARWFTFALPSAARSFRDSVALRIGATAVSAAGGPVRLSVYDVRVGA